MTAPILPVIGGSGSYNLAAPFDALAVNNVEYVCKAIRRISDYLANNEDVKENVYTANGVSDAIYEEDIAADAYIVSLQSMAGHYLNIPARFILSYPSVNGVPYRSLMIAVALPALPVAQDLSFLVAEITDIVAHGIGAAPNVRLVETSKVVQVSTEDHQVTQQRRAQASAGETTLTAKNVRLQAENAALLQRLQTLEQYIIDKGL